MAPKSGAKVVKSLIHCRIYPFLKPKNGLYGCSVGACF